MQRDESPYDAEFAVGFVALGVGDEVDVEAGGDQVTGAQFMLSAFKGVGAISRGARSPRGRYSIPSGRLSAPSGSARGGRLGLGIAKTDYAALFNL